MSGLESAIRSALEKSDRANPDIRARIYQSARQALDSGLAKQGITDGQVIAAQRQRLELKIREIEGEERGRVPLQPPREVSAQPAVSPAASPSAPGAHPQNSASEDAAVLGGATRNDAPGRAGHASDLSSLDTLRAHRTAPVADRLETGKAEPPAEEKGRRRTRDATTLDIPPERAAKPRRRRGFLSILMAWLVFFALIGAAVWWAYSSGIIQQSLQQAMDAANRGGANQTGAEQEGPQTGFSEDWVEVFDGSDQAAVQAGPSASAEAASTATGSAVRLTSASATAEGDVAIAIPAEILRELAGKSSTIALTVQSGSETAFQFSVRCDFGSLGNCARHRFTARQEAADVLLRVTFERSIAPNDPGRMLLNTGLDAADASLVLHSVRILPGQ